MNKWKKSDANFKAALTSLNLQWVDRFIACLNGVEKSENASDTVITAVSLRQLKKLIQEMIDADARRRRGMKKNDNN